MTEQKVSQSQQSPPWNRNVKVIVVVVILLLAALFAYRFQSLIALVVMAAILAYILNPIIVFVNKRTPVKRGTVILAIYLLLAVAVIWGLVAIGIAAFQQLSTLLIEAPELIEQVGAAVDSFTLGTEPLTVGPFSIDPSRLPYERIANEIVGFVEPVLSQGGQFVRSAATATVAVVGNLLFVFVISIYIANEIPQLGGYVAKLAQQPGYRYDAERLMREFGRIWSAYLRGQVILGLVIFLVVWLSLAALGVQNALALGLLSGLLEFIPVVGPIIGAGAAVIVALFQPSNYLGLVNWQFALAVLVVMIVIQQLENNILVPRIVGQALDLHPLLVMVGVFMGASLAGILGAILAAPVLATVKLLGVYAWRKMFDLPPFPKPEPDEPPPSPSLRERTRRYWAWLQSQRVGE